MDITQLKELILWAKSQKLKSLKVGDATFEFSDLAFIDGLNDLSSPGTEPAPRKDLAEPASSPRLPDGNVEANEDDELLYFSSR